MDKGTVYFFTGLAGAGKTTIGGLFYRRLKERKSNVFLADGDQVRNIFGRKDSARRGFRLWRELAEQGIDVVVCSIAMYDEIRNWNRENIENYKEVYIKVTQKTLYSRDQKQLYSSGRNEVVGVDLPFDEPRDADVVIQNDGQETPEAIIAQLWRAFGLEEAQ
mgnify:FL=1